MSVNHYSRDIQQYTLWWQHNQNTAGLETQPPENTTTWFRLHHDPTIDHHREPLFEKSLTPSDVGKLNRLVIPKQHAEKYFPLNATSSSSAAAIPGRDTTAETDKGMLLSFEDESGKWWRFRYSYWNSSQSYVLTKGWSRYVKEKQLDAGDVVFFQRHRVDARRLFIGWRRRGEASPSSATAAAVASSGGVHGAFANTASYDPNNWPVAYRQFHQVHGSIYANPLCHPEYSNLGATAAAEAHAPTGAAVGSSRTLRLFGVNLECQPPDDDDATEPSSPTGSSRDLAHSHHFYSYPSHAPPPPHGMSISFTGDTMSQMGDRRG